MIFLTVGTQFPFDRLIRAVDDLAGGGAISEEIFAQIGDSDYKPRNFQAVASLDKQAFDDRFATASAIISHAGMGTIAMALDHNKPLLAMPRRRKFGEVVNDHQEGLANKFAARGHILVACDESDLPPKVKELRTFVPKPRQVNPGAVVERIALFLGSLTRKGGSPTVGSSSSELRS